MTASETRISRFLTVPYSKEELNHMTADQRALAKGRGREKLISEEVIEKSRMEDTESLRRRILEICDRYHPSPIIITGMNTLDNSFLTDKPYRGKSKKEIFEIIVFRYKNPNAVEQEFKKLLNRSSRDQPIRKLEFLSENDYQKSVRKQLPKDDLALTDMLIMYTKYRISRILHRKSRASSINLSNLRSILNYDVEVLFRVIGKDMRKAVNAKEYYINFHRLTGSLHSITNSISTGPGMWISIS